MGINFEVKRKITVDGKDYERLDDVPPEVRVAILKTLAHGGTSTKTAIHVNGKTYSSVGDLPAPLRAIFGGLTSLVMKPEAKPIVIAIGLAVLLFWLARLVL